jgi:hypothetical protein
LKKLNVRMVATSYLSGFGIIVEEVSTMITPYLSGQSTTVEKMVFTFVYIIEPNAMFLLARDE